MRTLEFSSTITVPNSALQSDRKELRLIPSLGCARNPQIIYRGMKC